MTVNRFSDNGSISKKRKETLAERDQKASDILATRYDALNQLLAKAEERLRALKPVYPVWIDYNHQSEDGPAQWEVLGITKHLGKWRLCHGYDSDLSEEGFHDLKPIVECPVDVRVRAAKRIRSLHKEIIEAKEDYIPKVDDSIRELSEWLEGLQEI